MSLRRNSYRVKVLSGDHESVRTKKRRNSDTVFDILKTFSKSSAISRVQKKKKMKTVSFPLNVILEVAVTQGDIPELTKQVNIHGAEILNRTDVSGKPLVVRAALLRDINVIDFFIRNKADLAAADDQGWTALHYAASDDDLGIASELLKADLTLTMHRTHTGCRPVDVASSPKLVTLLVYGNLMALNKEIKELSRCKVCSEEMESDTEFKECKDCCEKLSTCTEDAERKLIMSIITLQKKELLLQDLKAKEELYGCSILHYAARMNYVHFAWLLLQEGIVNVDLQDDTGKTSLHWAVYNNHIEMVVLLREFDSSVDICDNDGLLPSNMTYYPFTLDVLHYD